LPHGVFIAKLEERREDDWSAFCHDDLSEQLCVDTVRQPGQRGLLRSHEKGKVWERRLLVSRPLLVSSPRINLRHQDRAKRKFADLGFSRQTARTAAGGIDLGPALQDARDDGGAHLADVCPKRRSNDGRGREKIPPLA
jgi:hypothetical protein